MVGPGEILHTEGQGGYPDLPLSHPKTDQRLTVPEQGVMAHLQTWATGVCCLCSLSYLSTGEERLEASEAALENKEAEVQSSVRENVPLSGLFNSY